MVIGVGASLPNDPVMTDGTVAAGRGRVRPHSADGRGAENTQVDEGGGGE